MNATAIIAVSVGVLCWAVGFVAGCRTRARMTVKRANKVMREYDSDPINQRQESRYLGRSEYGTDWYEMLPFGGGR